MLPQPREITRIPPGSDSNLTFVLSIDSKGKFVPYRADIQ